MKSCQSCLWAASECHCETHHAHSLCNVASIEQPITRCEIASQKLTVGMLSESSQSGHVASFSEDGVHGHSDSKVMGYVS